jgi:outer membrane protein TolC
MGIFQKEDSAMTQEQVSRMRQALEAAERHIKELQQSFDDAFEQRNTAIRERDELRKALEPNAAIRARASGNREGGE